MHPPRTEQLQNQLQLWGPLAFAYWTLYRIARRTLGLCLFRINVRLIPPPGAGRIAETGLVCRPLARDEVMQLAADPQFELSRVTAERALRRGDFCIGAFKGDQIVAYAWRSFDTAPHADNVVVRVRPPYCYSYKAFTRSEYRGKGIWPALASASDRLCLDRGCDRMIGFIEIHNFASQRAAQKMGATVIGTAGYIRLFGRSLTFHDRSVKRTSFRFEQAPGNKPDS